MLKWLVTRGPSSPSSLENDVTDDPLATITRRTKKDPIYAVTRVNPIFEDDGKGITTVTIETREENQIDRLLPSKEIPESPPTDRDSVQSSGYGSKEADSVSYKSDYQEEEEEEEEIESSEIIIVKKNSVRKRQRDPLSEDFEENFKSPGSVSELRRSFENLSVNSDNSKSFLIQKTNKVEIVHQNADFVKSIEIGCQNFSHPGSLEVIPEVSESAENSPSKSSWPRVSQLARTLQRQAEKIHERREREKLKNLGQTQRGTVENVDRITMLRIDPLVRVVAQNKQYVTAISVTPRGKLNSELNNNINYNSDYIDLSDYNNHSTPSHPHVNINTTDALMPSCFKPCNSISQNEFPLLSFQPDSLITEETLYMMNFPEFEQNTNYTDNNSIYEISPRDMPDFARAIYSGFYSSNKSGSSCSQESVSGKSGTSSNSCNRTCAKKKGVSVVKDLWEKSGLKTNGRKLLVDVNDLIDQDNRLLTISRKSSYDSNEEYRSLHSTVGNGSSQYKRPGGEAGPSGSNRSSNTYEEVYGSPLHSSGAYEEISVGERGVDNPVFIDDCGRASNSAPASFHSKAGFNFQHSLTNFQKRVSENVQDEHCQRKTWSDVEKGSSCDFRSSEKSFGTKGLLSKGKSSGKATKKPKTIPGKAVREFGLDERDWKVNKHLDQSENEGRLHPWNSLQSQRNEGYTPEGFGHQNRQQFWDTHSGKNFNDGNFSGIFSPHPNSEALTCGEDGTPCQDFTLDARKSHRILRRSSKSEKRKRCCSFVIVIAAFFFFIGAIVGVSWFYTGGQRIFGPM